MTNTEPNTRLIHGVEVVPGKIAVSDFLREVVKRAGGNHKYDGDFDELVELVTANFQNWKPGIGSVDGDVRVVTLPREGFWSSIVEITPENSHLLRVRYEPRVEGEAPVPQLVFAGLQRQPANFAGAVIYRADVLARDDSRSSDAQWEIVAILADPVEDVPMHPATMARNSAHEKGGTQRSYSSEQWLRANQFWQRHAVIASDGPF